MSEEATSESGAARPSPQINRSRRPWPLTIFCSIGFIMFPIFLITYFAPDASSMMIAATSEAFYQWHFAFSCTQIFAYIGLWRMKKWGLYLFLISSLVLIPYHYMQTREIVELHHQVVAEETAPNYQPPADAKKTDILTKEARGYIRDGSPCGPWVNFGKNTFISLCVIFIALLSRRDMTDGAW